MAERPSAVISRVAASGGGRGPSVGSIEARFGQALPLIGFGAQPNPNVKFIGELQNRVPVRGENKAERRQVRPITRVQSQPTRSELIFFPNARSAEVRLAPRVIPSPIEYQRLARRVRVIQRSILTRQARVVANPEVLTAPSSQVQTGTEPAARAFTQTAVETSNKTKAEAGRPIVNKVKTRNGLSVAINRTNTEL